MAELNQLFRDIESFLKAQRGGKSADIKDIIQTEPPPDCRFRLPFTFRCPECTNTCTHSVANKDSLKCTFTKHQIDCPHYKPDPNYFVLLQFKRIQEQVKAMVLQFEEKEDKESLEAAIKAVEAVIKLIKQNRDVPFFAGARNFAWLNYEFKLMDLEKERARFPGNKKNWLRLLLRR